ncbi:MAG: MFS transporter [Planctomycetaceae bacterium]|nr:MFS transporter [Planctomycetaceae bacterium]
MKRTQDESQTGVAPPSLLQDRSFLGITATQFLGAFNDNLFKQLMLLLAIPPSSISASSGDRQAVATIVFSLPFILFSGYAGYLSDRYSKTRVIVLSKVAEIVVMALGLFAFLFYATSGSVGLLFVLFLMGLQSTFFGPGKYGMLPEMLPDEQLPRANGIILMTTFIAIIFGMATAGVLKKFFMDDSALVHLQAVGLWKGSAICVCIAIAGTVSSLLIRRLPPSQPDLLLKRNSLVIPNDIRRLLLADRPLLLALMASCVFWLVSGIAIQAVNSLGIVQLELDSMWTSVLAAVIGVGISIGAVIAGRLCHGRADFRIVRVGMVGMVVCLFVLSISLPGGSHLLGFYGSLVVLTLLGISAGFFAIPVQVFIQQRPPDGQKGRMIAVMNFVNFIAILFSGVLYGLFDYIVSSNEWPRAAVFAMMAAIMLPLAILYRPPSEPKPP